MIRDRTVSSSNRPPPSVNRLLGSLPRRVRPHCSHTRPDFPHAEDHPAQPDEPIQHVYFPTGGFSPSRRFSRMAGWSKWRPSAVRDRWGVSHAERRACAVDGDGASGNGDLLSSVGQRFLPGSGARRRILHRRRPLLPSLCRVRDAVDGVQCRPFRRTATRPMAIDGVGPRRRPRVPIDTGVCRDDARHGSVADRDASEDHGTAVKDDPRPSVGACSPRSRVIAPSVTFCRSTQSSPMMALA
jgi:hypothetical protein